MEEYSVSQFLAHINQTLAYDVGSVAIIGEVSGLQISNQQYVWFSLKDEASIVQCFLFFFEYKRINVAIADGMKVKVEGIAKIFTKSGRFSFTVKNIFLVGEGSLLKKLEELKKKLTAEGIFDEERKRTLPRFPLNVGVLSAKDGAAIKDFLKVLKGRFGGVTIYFKNVKVQGPGAAEDVARGLATFNESYSFLDVIAIIRGGGSFEDLMAFNDETLVRAVYASKIPVISGIGHERDWTLVDFAADARGATPSNAAEILFPSRDELLENLRYSQSQIIFGIKRIFERKQETIKMFLRISQNWFSRINRELEFAAQNIVAGMKKMQTGIIRAIEIIQLKKENILRQESSWLKNIGNKLGHAQSILKAFDPSANLQKGYSILSKNGVVVSSIKQVNKGDDLDITLSDGSVGAVAK